MSGPGDPYGRDRDAHAAARVVGHVRTSRLPLLDAPAHRPDDQAARRGTRHPHGVAPGLSPAADDQSAAARDRGDGTRRDVRLGSAAAAAGPPARPLRPGRGHSAPAHPCQRRRIAWASIGIAALLLLAFAVQHSVTAQAEALTVVFVLMTGVNDDSSAANSTTS